MSNNNAIYVKNVLNFNHLISLNLDWFFFFLDTFLYTSILGSFIWLNSMGYYIWRTFKSRNVFLRITDGRKYCYYSLYVWGFTLTMGGMALFAHLILDTRNNNINKNNYSSHPSSDTSLEGAIGNFNNIIRISES